MLEIRVRKRLGDFLLDAELSLEETGITVLFGRSGAGKTTLVNLIAGLLSPDEGFISHGGDVFFDSERGIALPQDHGGHTRERKASQRTGRTCSLLSTGSQKRQSQEQA